jgi:hypothetical protein
MVDVKAESLIYDPADEGLLRRLGGAVIVQWKNLPSDARELIFDQANFMSDRDETVQLREQLGAFISRLKK